METLTYMALGVAVWTAIRALWRLADTTAAVPAPGQPVATDLAQRSARERLACWLKDFGITGDANIRGGAVVETIPPGDLSDTISNLRLRCHRLLNLCASGHANGRDLYFAERTGYPATTFRLSGIDLDDIAKLVVLSERVAEDRRRSRSLYKGLTDDEVDAMATVAVRKVQGMLVHPTAIQLSIARAAIETLFEIKGASA